ncbi:MAG TPA: hypothetical protein VNM15_01055 [Candidatus Binatia bacterium]|nr:hypothetical protein [Candidatus Binatia bacterium]
MRPVSFVKEKRIQSVMKIAIYGFFNTPWAWHGFCFRLGSVRLDQNLIDQSGSSQKGGELMELLKRLMVEEDGQGLVEYTLIVLLVALVFWVAIKETNIGSQLASGWSKVTACVGDPTNCNSGS